jgi:hypothetical protein
VPGSLVLQALRHVWLTLAPTKIPVAVVGGIALAAWKHVRATQDIDLLLGIDSKEVDRFLPQLNKAGIQLKSHSPPIQLGQLELIQLSYEPPEALMELQIDILLSSAPYHRTALERKVPVTLPDLDVQIAVLACEDMILHKLLAGRMIDLADAAAIFHLNRESLDLDYIDHWSQALHLDAEFAEVQRER